MSQAGKFIPGGGNKAKRTGPIRAPDPSAPAGSPAPGGGGEKKKLLTVGGINKRISKQQKWPIYAMSAGVLCLLCSLAWYIFGYLPMKHNAELAQLQYQQEQQALAHLGEARHVPEGGCGVGAGSGHGGRLFRSRSGRRPIRWRS